MCVQLKPENLVLDENFNLKIVDFGLAALIDDAAHRNATTNPSVDGEQQGDRSNGEPLAPVLHSGIGSQPYTAPEVFYNKELYHARGYRGAPADIWCVGCTSFAQYIHVRTTHMRRYCAGLAPSFCSSC